jgi:uncharacterized glyoxalase superfamily protein PhnB
MPVRLQCRRPIEDHGERLAGVKDLAGNEWYIAKRLSGSHTDEGLRTVNVYLHPSGAAEMLKFLTACFAAEEIVSHRETPEGPVLHAKVRIGDSVLEMGEAHGPYQPMSSMLYLYVDDVDAWYERAVAEGQRQWRNQRIQFYGDPRWRSHRPVRQHLVYGDAHQGRERMISVLI